MNRRAFLAGAGAVLSLGAVGQRAASRPDPVDVRVWFSDRAADHDGLEARVEGYLGAALEDALGVAPVIDFADRTVALPSEGGRDVLSVHWPARVVEGLVGMGDVRPADDVNLLVTDGDPTAQPAGYARPRVAAVTGAAAIAQMPPVEEAPPVVPYSVPAAATQLLLHECGHALGVDHEHGSVRLEGDALVASPMVGSYAWASERVREKQLDGESACGGSFPTDADASERRLGLRYADCAAGALR